MHINSVSNYSQFNFLKKEMSSLNVFQNKIFIIASIAIAAVASIFFAMRYLKLQKSYNILKNQVANQPVVNSPKMQFNVINTTDKDGNVYEGESRNGQLDGDGKITFKNGATYEGQFKAGLLNGQGIKILNGITYKGHFKDNNLHGKGTKKDKNGSVYEGPFIMNLLNGDGKRTDKNGTVYKGLFQDDCLVQGTKTQSDGTISDGKFINHKFVEGTKTESDGTIFDGKFENDHLVQGKATFKDGTVHDGIFKYGVLVDGTKTDPDGTISKGQFCLKDKKLNGQGRRTDKDGTTYDGLFENDLLVEGKVIFDGLTYEGNFRWNLKDVKDQNITFSLLKGKVTCSDGTVYEGYFKDYKLYICNTITSPIGFVDSLHLEEDLSFKDGKEYEGQIREIDSKHGIQYVSGKRIPY